MHLENVAADRTHKRREECEGLFNHITGLKFLKMLMFLLDLHDIMKFLSLQFQKKFLLLINVLPLLEKSLLDVANLQGGKVPNMLRFASDFEHTAKNRGVQLNRGRVAARTQRQARLHEYGICAQAQDNNTSVAAMLFGPFNFYCQAVTDALNERFSVFKEEPFCCFVIFDFRRWPSTSTKTAFEKYGDMELAKILHWYRNIIPEESCIAAKCEWLHFKVAVSDMHACKSSEHRTF